MSTSTELRSHKRQNQDDSSINLPKRKCYILKILSQELANKLKIYNENIVELFLQKQFKSQIPIQHSEFFSQWKVDEDFSLIEKVLMEKGVMLTQADNFKSDVENGFSEPIISQNEEFDESTKNSQKNVKEESQSIIERAKNDAAILKRVAQLRRNGQWSIKQLPKIKEPDRNKGHWDYMLEEMRWMSKDFSNERQWKKNGANMIAKLCMKHYQKCQLKEERENFEKRMRAKTIARQQARMVEEFWDKINSAAKNIEYSTESEVDLESFDSNGENVEEHVVICQLSERQRFLYDQFLDKIKEMKVSNDYSKINQILNFLLRVCNHPDLVEPRNFNSSFVLPKIVYETSKLIPGLLDRQTKPDILGLFGSNLITMENYSKSELACIESLRFDPSVIQNFDSVPDALNYVGTVELNIPANMNRPKISSLLTHEKNLGTENDLFEDHSLKYLPLESFRGFSNNFNNLFMEQKLEKSNFSIVRENRGDWSDGKKERLFAINDRNHSIRLSQPLYGHDLRSAVTTHVTSKNELSSPTLQKKKDFLTTSALWNMTNPSIPSRSADVYKKFCVADRVMTDSAVLKTFSRSFESNLFQTICNELKTRTDISEISTRFYEFPDKRQIKLDCGKLQVLDKMLKWLQKLNKKPVIFTKMHEMLDLLELFLTNYLYRYLRVDENTSYGQELVDMFSSDSRFFVCIMSPHVLVDLSKIDTVILYDEDWDKYTHYFTDLGCLKSKAHIYRLFNEKTVEEAFFKATHGTRFLSNFSNEGISAVKMVENHISAILDIPPKWSLDYNIADNYDLRLCEQEEQINDSVVEMREETEICPDNLFSEESPSDMKPIELLALKYRKDNINTFSEKQRNELKFKDHFEFKFTEIDQFEDQTEEWETQFQNMQCFYLEDTIYMEPEDYIYGEEVSDVYLPPIVPDSIVPVEVEHTEQIYKNLSVSYLGRRCKLKKNENNDRNITPFFTNVDENTNFNAESKRRGDKKLLQSVDAKQEWLIDEEWSILQTSRRLLMRPSFLGLSVASNWNMSSQAVAIKTGCVLSSKLISSRFYSTIGPREEGKYLTELNTRKAVKGRFIFPKTNKQIRTDELYARDDGIAIQDSAEKIIPICISESHHRERFCGCFESFPIVYRIIKSISEDKIKSNLSSIRASVKNQIKKTYFTYLSLKKQQKDENIAENIPSKFQNICVSLRDSIPFFRRIPRRYMSLPLYHIKNQSCRVRTKPMTVYASSIVVSRNKSNILRGLMGMQFHHFLRLLGHHQPKQQKAPVPIAHVNFTPKNYRMPTRFEHEMMFKQQYRRTLEQSEQPIQHKNPRPVMNSMGLADESKYRHFFTKSGQVPVHYIQQSPTLRPIASPINSTCYSMPSNYPQQSGVSQRPQIGNYISRVPYNPKLPRQIPNVYNQFPADSPTTSSISGSPIRRNLSSLYLDEQNRRNHQITTTLSQRTPMPQQIRPSSINLTSRPSIPLSSRPRKPNSVLNRAAYVGVTNANTSTPTIISTSNRPIKLHISNNGSVRPPVSTDPIILTATTSAISLPSTISWPNSSNLGINSGNRNHPARK